MSDDKVIPWTMVEGVETEIKYKDKIWVCKTHNQVPRLMSRKPCGPTNRLMLWLSKKKTGDVFTLDDFYKETKTSRGSNHRYERILIDLIKEGKYLQQYDNKRIRVIDKIKLVDKKL